MPLYQQYDTVTGEILAALTIPEEAAKYAKEHGMNLILDTSTDTAPSTHYVDISAIPHKIKLRPEQNTIQNKNKIIANGEDFVRLYNLPTPCKISFNEHVYEVDDGEIQWSTFTPLCYKISVKSFPYLDFESVVNAVESYTQSGE